MPLAIAAGIGAVGSLASGLIGASASQSAAKAQSSAAMDAAIVSNIQYVLNTQKLQPYMDAGQSALTQLSAAEPTLTKPFAPTMDQLAATPGYQFALQQGTQAAQNGFAAQGLSQSGAAIKGGVNYAEGLASTTFQQQFQNYLSQNQQIYNMLYQPASLGENAAAQSGNQGVANTANTVNAITGGAAASAAGTIGAANATTGAIGGVSNALTNAIGLNYVGNLFGSGGSGLSNSDFNGITDSMIMGN